MQSRRNFIGNLATGLAGTLGKVTAIHAHMYRNAPHGMRWDAVKEEVA